MLEKVSRGEPVTPPLSAIGCRKNNTYSIPLPPPLFSGCSAYARRGSVQRNRPPAQRHGIPTARGQRWETRAVAYLLHNPVYLGKIRWNLPSGTKQSPPPGQSSRMGCTKP
ncbi:MAG: recombinase family protein [Anaeromassilibacillus sp.]